MRAVSQTSWRVSGHARAHEGEYRSRVAADQLERWHGVAQLVWLIRLSCEGEDDYSHSVETIAHC